MSNPNIFVYITLIRNQHYYVSHYYGADPPDNTISLWSTHDALICFPENMWSWIKTKDHKFLGRHYIPGEKDKPWQQVYLGLYPTDALEFRMKF